MQRATATSTRRARSSCARSTSSTVAVPCTYPVACRSTALASIAAWSRWRLPSSIRFSRRKSASKTDRSRIRKTFSAGSRWGSGRATARPSRRTGTRRGGISRGSSPSRSSRAVRSIDLVPSIRRKAARQRARACNSVTRQVGCGSPRTACATSSICFRTSRSMRAMRNTATRSNRPMTVGSAVRARRTRRRSIATASTCCGRAVPSCGSTMSRRRCGMPSSASASRCASRRRIRATSTTAISSTWPHTAKPTSSLHRGCTCSRACASIAFNGTSTTA